MKVGDPIPARTYRMTQEIINAWAEVSTDKNPLHVDLAFAQASPFGGTIAHGHIAVSWLCAMLQKFFGRNWLEGGKLFEVKFIAPVRPGDEISVKGQVIGLDAGRASCEVWVEKAGGEKCVVGKAECAI
jgi:3-hydroxybutyryl-CoA dehydratase